MSKRGGTILITGAIAVAAAALVVKDYLHTPYDTLLADVGKAWSISPSLLKAIARKESNFKPNVIVNEPNGTKSYGMFQINDIVARDYGINTSTLTDPTVGAHVASRLLNDIRIRLVKADKFSIQAWIDSYREGVGGFLQSGINTARDIAYTGEVYSHYFLYTLAEAFA